MWDLGNCQHFTHNIFVGVGCDTQAVIRGFRQDHRNGFEVGCISKCYSIEFIDDNACSGIGCCQISLARLPNISIALSSFQNHSGTLDFNPCSYAFIVEKKQFNFTISYLKNLQNVDRLPMVIEWTIDTDNCSTVKENMMYSACLANYSECYDPENGPGYRCKCLDGYQGNPYLNDGCQDIDECKNSAMNDCEGTCVNTQGSYYCVCPRWHHGDGRKGGQGCIPLKLLLIVIVGCSTGLGLPFLSLFAWCLYKVVKRRKEIKTKKEFFERNGGLILQQQISSGDTVRMATKLFTSKELERATDNYNENRILGRGGQGTVYKGMLEDGRIVAIKKSKIIDKNQLDQFINEVVVLQQINHRNVVKLLGCCLETKVPMLVYEFILNGTLYDHLHDQNEEFSMRWDIRIRIAIEVADALSYLHSAASNPIYHCDIKSANILLDEKFRAKVADFGISRSIDLDKTHFTMPNVQGTFGYLDPEYFRSSQFTDKSDVYSFGIVLVELLTGQKAVSFARSESERSLANYFLVAVEKNRLSEIVDNRVVKKASEEAIVAIAKLGKRCLNMVGQNRPTMREVVTELRGIRGSHGVFVNKPSEQEVGVENEINGHWEAFSASIMAFTNCGTGSSSDVEPLIFNSF